MYRQVPVKPIHLLRFFLFFTTATAVLADSSVRLEFETLDGWKEQAFLYVKESSYYAAEEIDGVSVLSVRSDGGISALVHEEYFEVSETPVLEWRWRVEDFPSGADPRQEKTDDFALRVYVMFHYDKGTIPLGERIKYGFVKIVYNEFPPKSVLGFVWPENSFADQYIQSTINSRTRYIDAGSAGSAGWQTVTVNVAAEYRRVFGEAPPSLARISIIGDSDGTRDSTLGYIDYIHLKPASE